MKSDLPVLTDCCGYGIFQIKTSLDAGTHTIFLGELQDAVMIHDEIPMTYAYYHQVIKGATPPHAPTYVQ